MFVSGWGVWLSLVAMFSGGRPNVVTPGFTGVQEPSSEGPTFGSTAGVL